jgi:hypothetical protein
LALENGKKGSQDLLQELPENKLVFDMLLGNKIIEERCVT